LALGQTKEGLIREGDLFEKETSSTVLIARGGMDDTGRVAFSIAHETTCSSKIVGTNHSVSTRPWK
jgi:hypothetical protein